MKRSPKLELISLALLAVILFASVIVLWKMIATRQRELEKAADTYVMQETAFPELDVTLIQESMNKLLEPSLAPIHEKPMFSSEQRVVAIGSAYPIPYDAEICPYTGIPQPKMNQLDRDGDGITDDWELTYGLSNRNHRDAQLDLDGDGFTNLEEFKAMSDPTRAEDHPPLILKWRLAEIREKLFPYVFEGSIELSDGREVFQLNKPDTGSSFFLEIGESAEGVIIKGFKKSFSGSSGLLIVERNGYEITLQKNVQILDPENEAEIINILDQQTKIITMGALLSLKSEIYTVISIDQAKVVVALKGSEKTFEIVGFTDEERNGFSDGLN